MFKSVPTGVLPILFLASLLGSPAFAQKDFPDGTAKEYINQICLQCHQPAMLLGQHRSEEDWKTTVARMATKGVPGTVDQFDAIAAYMAKNFGKTAEDAKKINVNKAKADDLVTALGLPGMGRFAGYLRRRRPEDRSGQGQDDFLRTLRSNKKADDLEGRPLFYCQLNSV